MKLKIEWNLPSRKRLNWHCDLIGYIRNIPRFRAWHNDSDEIWVKNIEYNPRRFNMCFDYSGYILNSKERFEYGFSTSGKEACIGNIEYPISLKHFRSILNKKVNRNYLLDHYEFYTGINLRK